MKSLTSIAAAVSSLSLFATALPSQLEQRVANGYYPYAKPSLDPFYTANPANLSDYALGAIVKTRQLANNLTSLLPANVVANLSATWQIAYRTQDIFGNASLSTATIWVPLNGNPNKLLSYQPPWDAPNIDCVSSYDLQNGYLFSKKVERKLPANLIPISALNLGWYILLPDHEQTIAALGSGLTGAHATLDGIRAALNSASFTGVSPSASIGLSGYSGGAPPTEFAMEIQPTYAPELNIVGAVQGGINPDSLFQLNLAKLPDLQFQNLLGQLNGLSKAYPNLSTYLDNNLIEARKKQFFQQEHSCTPKTSLDLFSLYFKNPLNGVKDPIVQSVWKWGTTYGLQGTPSKTIPQYINQGMKGPLSTDYPDNFVSQSCAKGVQITYARNEKTNHDGESVIGNAGELLWLQDRFDGKPLPSGCTTLSLTTTTLAPAQKTLYGEPIYNEFVKAAKALEAGAII